MKISATGGGGFAGNTMQHEVDTRSSPAGPALEAALADSAFFDAAAADGNEVIGADIPRWSITVDADGRRHTITFADDGNPANARWRRLLDRILAS